MSNKTKLVVAFAVLLISMFMISAVFAQGPRTGNQGHHGNIDHGNGMMGNAGLMGNGNNGNQGNCLGDANCMGYGYMGNGYMFMGANLPAASTEPLTENVVAAITAGVMDEYNAYLTYQAVIDQLGSLRPFTNIQAAEAQHIAAWEMIFDRYGIDLPEMPASVDTPTFASRAEACQIAADAEIANFGLYDDMAEAVQNYPDIAWVVQNLRNASEYNHLPAFEQCAATGW